jgi:hypothetical protein
MNTIETRRYEMLVRVRDFGKAHADLFPTASPGGKAFETVEAAVTELGRHAVLKMSSQGAARDSGQRRETARTAVREQIDAISRTADLMAEDKPDVAERFRMPKARNDQALLTAGRLFVRESEAVEAEFLAHGMPSTFRADLNTAVQRFEHALHHRDAGRAGQTAAQAGISAALESGTAAVESLDVIIANRLRGDAVTMAVWERERRVKYPRSAGNVVAAPTPAPAATSDVEEGVTS